MIRLFLLGVVTLTFSMGCSNSAVEDKTANAESKTDAEKPTAGTAANTDAEAGTQIELTPANTEIEFVGSHVVDTPPDPMARHGKFQKFSGTATIKDDKLTGISIDIETASLDTGIEKLNGHLLNADFFDAKANPKASFVSTKIESSEDGKTTITGDLTLLKETKSISFPATVTTGDKFELSAEFKIDRTEFGMNYDVEKVEKEVELKVSVSGD